MSDKLKQTVRIVRGSKVGTDDRGQSVWTGPVEEAELELVSTSMLKGIIADGDAKREALRVAAAGKDGVLAKNLKSGSYEIIDDEDLLAALGSAASDTAQPAADVTLEPLMDRADIDDEALSLVSTQALRRMLNADAADTSVEPDVDDADDDGGSFDPYNSA